MADIDDDILIPCARGTDVVLAVVKKIECTGIFPPENQLLRRIASVESDDGWDRKTCRSGYHGGIWQVDKIGFMHTQDTRSHRNLLAKFEKIKKHFCIDWSEVTWEDLRKPFYSGLAARLVLSIEPTALPPAHQIRKQAEYWRDSSQKWEVKGIQFGNLSRKCHVSVCIIFPFHIQVFPMKSLTADWTGRIVAASEQASYLLYNVFLSCMFRLAITTVVFHYTLLLIARGVI